MLRQLTFSLCILIMYSIPLFRTAFRDPVPVMTGYVFLGFGFGILALQNGLSIWRAMAMSVLIYAGAMQFVVVTMLSGFCPF